MAFFEGCPVGWAGKGWLGGERLGGYPTGPELAWLRGQGRLGKAGWVPTRSGLVDGVREAGQGLGGGCKGFGSGEVSGSNVCRTKRRKMAFFEGCPVGWGGVPTGAGLVDGGGWGGGDDGSSGKLAWRSEGVQGLRLRGGRW